MPVKPAEKTELEIAKEKLAAKGEEAARNNTKKATRELLLQKFPDTKPKVLDDIILAQEFGRRPDRQPTISEKGELVRTTKKGETLNLEDTKYWEDRYGDYLVKSKTQEGEIAIELALSGVGNLSIQSQLVKQWGPERTAQLLALVGGELGKIKTTPNAPGPVIKGAPDKATNPWGKAAWNVTEQGRLTRVFGEERARAFCKSAGATWGQTKPPKE